MDWEQPFFARDDMLETAVFGKSVESFLSSDIGQYLIAHADEQAADALSALKRVAPWRTRKVRDLQGTISLWEGFRGRLAQALADGEQAVKLLEDSD